MKKLFSYFGAMALVAFFSACGGGQSDNSADSSEKPKETPKELKVNVDFKGEISQYYTATKGLLSFKKDEKSPKYDICLEVDLTRNGIPFKLDPKILEYGGEFVNGMREPPIKGYWYMAAKIQDDEHDDITGLCTNAQKLFEYYPNEGDVCHLKFTSAIDGKYEKEKVEAFEKIISGEANGYYILDGGLWEK